MPNEIQTAVVGLILIVISAASSLVGATVNSLVSRRQNRDIINKNQALMEAAILKQSADFDVKYQTFFIDRFAGLLDERKQLFEERATLSEEYRTYQRDTGIALTKAEEGVKRLEMSLSLQEQKLNALRNEVDKLNAERDQLRVDLINRTNEKKVLEESLIAANKVIADQRESVKELFELRGKYTTLEARVVELEANEKALNLKLSELQVAEAKLIERARIFEDDRNRLAAQLFSVTQEAITKIDLAAGEVVNEGKE